MESRFTGKRLGMPLQVLVWVVTLVIAYMVVPKGYAKVFDYASGTLGFFESLGLPFWLMMTVGVIELVGPFLMLIPKVSFYPALSLAVVLFSAAYYDGWQVMTLALAGASLVIAFLMRPAMLRKKPEVTTINV